MRGLWAIRNISIQVRRSVEARLNRSSSRARFAQHFDKSLTGEIVSVFGVAGIFEGQVARIGQEISETRIDPVVIRVYFHPLSLDALHRRIPSAWLDAKEIPRQSSFRAACG